MNKEPPREAGGVFPMNLGHLEQLAKGVAFLSAAAITTAFLFNSAYFAVLNLRLLGTLTLSDHIATAIWCLPIVIVISGIVVGFGFAGNSMRGVYANLGDMAKAGSKWAKFTGWSATIVYLIGFGLLVAYMFSSDFEWRSIVAIAIGAAIASFAEWMVRQSARLLVVLPLLFLAFTIVFAVGAAIELKSRLNSGLLVRPDTVEMTDRTHVFGRVVRMLDRGVILGTASPETFMFIPKEQIRRVDLTSSWKD